MQNNIDELNYNNLWINKYKPNNIAQIIGNKENIKIFKDWILDIKSKKNQTIIISGNQGLGKTLTVNLILEELGYIVRIINPNEIKDHRIYDDFNDYHNFINSIYSKVSFNNKQNNKIALIFDETENITLTSEKKYIMDIYKENNKLRSFPLIFISNNHHSKLLYDLKKSCNEIIFENPTYNELREYIITIYNSEKILLENNDSIITKIINFCQYDIRRLINLLQELVYHINDNILSESIVNEFIENSRNKNIDIGLFDATNNILNNYLDYDTIQKLYESEKVLLPLMIHENYTKKILNKSSLSFDDIMFIMIKVSDSISKGDNIETSIYTDQNWYLQNIHGFYTCINTSYWINKDKTNSKLSNNNIKFSSDLNKTSLKNINRKNIVNLQKIINNKCNQEILILNKIANNLFKQGNENILINILYQYNKDISIKEIELFLKIDKTIDYLTLGSKDKKNIMKFLTKKN